MLSDKVLEKACIAVELLKQKNLTVATAESCTGGMVSQFITAVSGASDVFSMGVCAYSCEVKHKLLDVSTDVLEKHGAVSKDTAALMAAGIRKKAESDIGLSVTGSAGPASCEGHPAGHVFIALANSENTIVKLLNIDPINREYVRQSATLESFNLLIDYLGKSK